MTRGSNAAKLQQLLTAAAFHAYPFTEALTGQIYARARWLDPATGTFLTPDPMGYQDSSNLYAFVGGDPVNGRDPTGLCGEKGEERCGFFAAAWKSAKKTVAEQAELGVDAVFYVADFFTDEGRQRNAQATFDAGMRFAECGGDADCVTALLNRLGEDVLTYLDALPEERNAILGEITGRWSVYAAEAYVGGRIVGGARLGATRGESSSLPPKANAPVPDVLPGQVASAYPRGRRVGGRGESVRPTDPPAGLRESGAFDLTPDNVRLMEAGRPPIGRDGLSVELHHRNQNPAGPLDEMTSRSHDLVPHPISPSQINRSQFAGERARYWRQRVRELHGQR